MMLAKTMQSAIHFDLNKARHTLPLMALITSSEFDKSESGEVSMALGLAILSINSTSHPVPTATLIQPALSSTKANQAQLARQLGSAFLFINRASHPLPLTILI